MGFGKDGKGVIIAEQNSITLATLAAATALKEGAPLAITEDFRVISVKGVAAVEGMASDEFIMFGICSDELSLAEIVANLTSGQMDPDDNQAKADSLFPVFVVGVLGGNGSGSQNLMKFDETIRWTFSSTNGFVWFAFNFSTAALTTGGILRILVKRFGVWVV